MSVSWIMGMPTCAQKYSFNICPGHFRNKCSIFVVSLHKCVKRFLVLVVFKNVDWCRTVSSREEKREDLCCIKLLHYSKKIFVVA